MSCVTHDNFLCKVHYPGLDVGEWVEGLRGIIITIGCFRRVDSTEVFKKNS